MLIDDGANLAANPFADQSSDRVYRERSCKEWSAVERTLHIVLKKTISSYFLIAREIEWTILSHARFSSKQINASFFSLLVQVLPNGLSTTPSLTDHGSLPLTSSRDKPSSTRLSSHSSFSTTRPRPKTSWTMAIRSKSTSWTRTTAQVSAFVAWLRTS